MTKPSRPARAPDPGTDALPGETAPERELTEQERHLRRFHLDWLPLGFEALDDLLHAIVALVLVAVSVAVLAHVLWHDASEVLHAFSDSKQFFEPVLTVINDTLFVIIVLEILRTVTAHFHHQSFALQPFIIIGIISTVRHLLMTGAHLSLATEAVQPEQFWESIIELALNGVLTFILVGAYFLIRHADQLAQAEQD